MYGFQGGSARLTPNVDAVPMAQSENTAAVV